MDSGPFVAGSVNAGMLSDSALRPEPQSARRLGSPSRSMNARIMWLSGEMAQRNPASVGGVGVSATREAELDAMFFWAGDHSVTETGQAGKT